MHSFDVILLTAVAITSLPLGAKLTVLAARERRRREIERR